MVFDDESFSKVRPDLYKQFLKEKKTSSKIMMTIIPIEHKQLSEASNV